MGGCGAQGTSSTGPSLLIQCHTLSIVKHAGLQIHEMPSSTGSPQLLTLLTVKVADFLT